MFFFIVFSLLFAGLQANFLEDIGQFFKPADLGDKELATLGLSLFSAQWKEHGKAFSSDFPATKVVTKFIDQISAPLQFASFVVCPQCNSHVADIQKAIKENEDIPRWLVEIALPLTVCPAFYAVDAKLVPICFIAGFGGTVFLTHAEPSTVCSALPMCGTRSKRSYESTQSLQNLTPYARDTHGKGSVGAHDIVKRMTDVLDMMKSNRIGKVEDFQS